MANKKKGIDVWIKAKADEVMESKNFNILCDSGIIEEYQGVFYRIRKEVEHYKLDDDNTKLLTDYLDSVWDMNKNYTTQDIQKMIDDYAAVNQE